jgi:CRISPR/Cas system-associated exonuclease Cas4 (RecB family)
MDMKMTDDLWEKEFGELAFQSQKEEAPFSTRPKVFKKPDLDKMQFSYSRLNTFNTCKWAFYLNYVEKKESVNNVFGQYGTLIHEIMEKYFKNQIAEYHMPKIYLENFEKYVYFPFPAIFKGMRERYFAEGESFFDFFSFDKDKYDIICIEYAYEIPSFTIKPDLILKDKETGKYILFDYKTSKPEKVKEYATQMNVYAYYLKELLDIEISEIRIWFIRFDKIVNLPVNPEMGKKWIDSTLGELAKEETWEAKPNAFFCQNICGQRLNCTEWRK